MQISLRPFSLTKRTPLTISRGTSAGTVNVLVEVAHEGVVGWGEMAPSSVTGDTAETALADVAGLVDALMPLAPWELERVEDALRAAPTSAVGLDGVGGGSALRAAVEMACHDWLGKRANLPVWTLLGLDLSRTVATSVTVGINPPERAAAQTRDWRERLGARVFKLKLGSPDGIDADKAMFLAVRDAAGDGATLRVDANGGWSVADAQKMIGWLADRGVEYVEQPLVQGDLDGLLALRPAPIPIFVDESVRVAADVPRFVGRVDGVNVKLMKCGGLREALRIVAVARAHGLQTMLGCMGESSLAITAGAQIGAAFDHLDLDSHLNLRDDPFVGARWTDGKVIPGESPGLGVERC